jgi:hypothetical protein
MEIVITIVVTIAVIGIISAFILIRPNHTRKYSRMVDEEYREPETEPDTIPFARQRVPRMKNTGGDSNLASLVISIFRAVIGLAAVGVLAYIFTSTQNAVKDASDAVLTQIYAGGIFKALVTAGIAVALYIFTKFTK